MKVQYSERVDAVIYGAYAIAYFEQRDWIALALAALDQAGVLANDVLAIQQRLERYTEST
jgi:hypothetical protein